MINQEEYEILKGLDDKWKWIARDGVKNKLNVHELRPIKSAFVEWWFTNKWCGFSKIVPIDLFQFVQWEDEEPYRISDLIKEYEGKVDVGYALKEYAEHLSKFNEKLLTESEEEMKKDKDWLSEQVGELNSTDAVFYESGVSYIDTAVSMERVYELINQLDEPEVLSQELPVIPKYVAEWIANRRDDFDLYPALKILGDNSSIWGLTYKWYRINTHEFVNAYLTGEYEVEGEPLYRARLKVITDRFIASYLRTQSSDAKYRLKALEIGSKYIHEDHRHLSEFTENELKRLGIWGSEQWEVEELGVQEEEEC